MTRAKGEGSIHCDHVKDCPQMGKRPPRCKCRWVAVLDVSEPGGPRRRRKRVASTKKEAGERLAELRAELAAEEETEVSKRDRCNAERTVADLAAEWLDKGTRNHAESTLSRVRRRVQDHVVRHLGDELVATLPPERIEEWLQLEADAGQAERTLRDYLGDLRAMLRFAQRREYVDRNRAEFVTMPSNARKSDSKRTFTPDEARALLGVLGEDRLGPYFTTLLLLGLRPGEADALVWSAIDLDKAVMHVEAALQRDDTGRPLGIGPTKTRTTRSLAMPSAVVEALRRQRRRQLDDKMANRHVWTRDERWDDLVFVSEIGTPHNPSNVRRSFAKLCAQAEVPAITPYELRHSQASLLAAAGVPMREVADKLGHSTTRMLERHYLHRVDPVVTAGVDVMDQLVIGDRP